MWDDETRRSFKFASNDTAATGRTDTGRRRGAAAEGASILIEPPLGVRAKNEVSPSVPASDPMNAVVKEEKAKLFRTAALVQRDLEPAAALLQFGFKHVTVEDATVDECSRDFFIVFAPVPMDEVPSATFEELVGSRDGGIPVLFFEIAVTVALLEPVGRAEDGARTEEEVGCHD